MELVVLCGEKPTRSLLDRMFSNLPAQLASVAADDQYEVRMVFEEACLVVSTPEDKDKRSVVANIIVSNHANFVRRLD